MNIPAKLGVKELLIGAAFVVLVNIIITQVDRVSGGVISGLGGTKA